MTESGPSCCQSCLIISGNVTPRIRRICTGLPRRDVGRDSGWNSWHLNKCHARHPDERLLAVNFCLKNHIALSIHGVQCFLMCESLHMLQRQARWHFCVDHISNQLIRLDEGRGIFAHVCPATSSRSSHGSLQIREKGRAKSTTPCAKMAIAYTNTVKSQ